MNRLLNHRSQLVVGGLAIAYCLIALSYVATSPDVRVRALISEDDPRNRSEGVVTVQQIDGPSELQVGDQIVEVANQKTHSFVDFARAQAFLRSPDPEAVGSLTGMDPDTVPAESSYALQDVTGDGRYARVRYRRAAEERISWLKLQRQPAGGLLLSLTWFALHLVIYSLSAIALWKRPSDQPVRVFFAMCTVTVMAYVGCNHWWVLAGNLWLTLPFVISAVLLPGLLLHFFLVYPQPKEVLVRRPWPVLTAVYALPVVAATAMSALMILGAWWSETTRTLDVAELLPWLRDAIHAYFVVAGFYFLLSLAVLIHSHRHTRNPIEHSQVTWIVWAGVLAVIPVGYTLWLAAADRVDFAFGGARLPMFLASLAFTSAYAIGIARYKLMLIDQAVSRSMVYYICNLGLTLVFALLIAVAGVTAWRHGASPYSYEVPVIVLLVIAALVLAWLRDRMQRSVDRWFFREKYPIDKALQRMNRAVNSLLERGDVADNMLYSCCEVLRIEQATLYLRDADSRRFRLSAAVGKANVPFQFLAEHELLAQLEQGDSLQRVPSGTSPSQLMLRRLNADLIHGLEVDGEVAGLVALGSKLNGSAFSAEDVTFLTAVGRITGVALHCGKVHEDVSRLNAELRAKSDRITEQGRQIARLQTELNNVSESRTGPRLPTEFRREAIKGDSPAIRLVLDTVRKVSASDATVLVRGESGTGKELLARAIHENSLRRDGPLIAVHCGALAPSLLESELFGHVRGAFTDAREDKLGRFALADGGTLFLDEVGDISLEVQVKLLRVLQERMFEPVGGSHPTKVDVRVVAATNRDLEQLIAAQQFRQDLYYRLNVVSITLPPLRERGEDIFELALFFLRRAAERVGKNVLQMDDAVIDQLMQYEWPGNIRELENVIERAVVLADGDCITAVDLPAQFSSPPTTNRRPAPTLRPVAAQRVRIVAGSDDERELLSDALEKFRGNKAEAARFLDMPRSTYYSKLKRHGLG